MIAGIPASQNDLWSLRPKFSIKIGAIRLRTPPGSGGLSPGSLAPNMIQPG
ncbi:MAG TPA: hypothetical protein VJJ51_02325 [Candidatus Methanoperedens sp.]|nr:hypothetical protein [Candidatus Methanoperedens sp.]